MVTAAGPSAGFLPFQRRRGVCALGIPDNPVALASHMPCSDLIGIESDWRCRGRRSRDSHHTFVFVLNISYLDAVVFRVTEPRPIAHRVFWLHG